MVKNLEAYSVLSICVKCALLSAKEKHVGPLYTGENKMSDILDLIYFTLYQIISQQYVCLDH